MKTGQTILAAGFGRILSLVAGLTIGTSTFADDWPCFRGPNHDGVSKETGLLQKWPEGGPKLAWKATGLGAGYSTVAVVGNRVYTVGDQGDSSYLIALSGADGKEVWRSKLGKSGASGWGGFEGPRATPTVSGGRVFVLGQWGELAAYDAVKGAELWRKDLPKDFGGQRPEWGFSESPLVDGEKVMVTPGGSQGAVVALHCKSGELLWQSRDWTDGAQYSSLIISELGGVRQYIQLSGESVAGLKADTCALLWRAARKGRTATIPTPIEHEGMVFVTSDYGVGSHMFKVTAENGQFTVKEVWANKQMGNHHGGVVRIGDYVYGHAENKGWTCQNIKTGAPLWQEKDKLGKGAVVFADGCLYAREEDKGIVALLAASPAGYKELARFDPGDASGKKAWPHPVVAGGKLYLRDQDMLKVYEVSKTVPVAVGDAAR